jgi:hypothetical protein
MYKQSYVNGKIKGKTEIKTFLEAEVLRRPSNSPRLVSREG